MSYSAMGQTTNMTSSPTDPMAAVYGAFQQGADAARASAQSQPTPQLPGTVGELCQKVAALQSALPGLAQATLTMWNGTSVTAAEVSALLAHGDMAAICRLAPTVPLSGDALGYHYAVEHLLSQIPSPSTWIWPVVAVAAAGGLGLLGFVLWKKRKTR